MAKIQRRADDIAFSFCVKERAHWRCERCGKQFDPSSAAGLDCSHYFGRRGAAIRHHPWNAFAHCRGCHQHLGSNPEFFREHYLEVFGEEKLNAVRELRDNVALGRWVNRNRKVITAHLRQQHEILKEKRRDGICTRIEFEAVPCDILC